jgi:hypothetical protein
MMVQGLAIGACSHYFSKCEGLKTAPIQARDGGQTGRLAWECKGEWR